MSKSTTLQKHRKHLQDIKEYLVEIKFDYDNREINKKNLIGSLDAVITNISYLLTLMR